MSFKNSQNIRQLSMPNRFIANAFQGRGVGGGEWGGGVEGEGCLGVKSSETLRVFLTS